MEMSTIETTVPFTDDELVEHFTKSIDKVYDISYGNSSLKGEEFLTYLFNANVRCNLIDDVVDQELLHAYLRVNREISIPRLNSIIINSILNNDGVVSPEYANELHVVIKSFHYNMIQLMNDIEPTVTDDAPDYIGMNWVSLRDEPLFWELVARIAGDKSLTAHAYNIFNKFAYIENQNAYQLFLNELNPYGLLLNVYKEPKE
jgi:hypothetical protein